MTITTRTEEREAARFWKKVDKTTSCWMWAAGVDSHGYGRFTVNGRKVGAHKWAYEATIGPVLDGLELDHLCRNRACVNPSHLEAVSHRTNCLRGHTVTAKNAAKTHCKHGHEFTPENTYVLRGQRVCRACDKRRGNEYRQRIGKEGTHALPTPAADVPAAPEGPSAPAAASAGALSRCMVCDRTLGRTRGAAEYPVCLKCDGALPRMRKAV